MAGLAILSCHVALSLGIAGNWRQLYQAGQQSLKQKAAKLGKRLRAMTQAEVQSRQTKHVEVSVSCSMHHNHSSMLSPAALLTCYCMPFVLYLCCNGVASEAATLMSACLP